MSKTQSPPAEAYPLYWPEGWQRTRYRKASKFRVSRFGQARDLVLSNVRLMGGRNIVISSNIPLRQDGLPYANHRYCGSDPGIAVYWYDRPSKQQRCIACDRWRKAVDNMHAIAKSLDAIRGLVRWGSTEIVNRAFAGFAALPPSGDDWRSVLGVPYGERPTIEHVKNLHRELARTAHPDRGGNQHEMVRLNQAMEAAAKELLP